MVENLQNIFWLGVKELRSFSHDRFLLLFVVYAFSFAIYSQAVGLSHELHNVPIGIVDEDHSQLSRSIASAFLAPEFKPPEEILIGQVDPEMDAARFTFVIGIPPNFEADLRAGRQPEIQVNVDATAVMQAGLGAGHIQSIISREISRFVEDSAGEERGLIDLNIRLAFNQNLQTPWFTSIMGIINYVTMLGVLLSGAALIREREHGTIDHLLVMPVTPLEIMLAKGWSNGLVIVIAVALSLWLVVQGILDVPISGSVSLFLAGVTVYLFFATALGIFLATIARSMPQLGLLFIMVVLPMNLLSGGNTPLESMPRGLQIFMQMVPSTHFVSFSQAILYRGAGINIVWPQFLATAAVGLLFILISLARFRRAIARG